MDILDKFKPQRGFALFMTLVTLIIITISGISMMRVMQAGSSAAGNIAFRQASTKVAGVAAEDAIVWLSAQSKETLQNPTSGGAYNANAWTGFNPVTYNWATPHSTALPTNLVSGKLAGYDVNYVIHRMAMQNGLCVDAAAQAGCSYAAAASSVGISTGASHSGGVSYDSGISNTAGLVYYRLTVKVSGPRHNVNYLQALLY